MATATRKRPKATAVNHQLIGQASALLQELPEKQKEGLSLREAIGQMQEPLQAALAKGYNYADLAAMLSEQGIKISPLTLKNYVPSGKRQAAKTKAKRAKKSVAEAATPVEPAAAETAPASESSEVVAPDAPTETPDPTPAKRGRAKSVESTKPAAKTNPESKTSDRTPTRTRQTTASSRTKSVTKAPATRGRKKSDASK